MFEIIERPRKPPRLQVQLADIFGPTAGLSASEREEELQAQLEEANARAEQALQAGE